MPNNTTEKLNVENISWWGNVEKTDYKKVLEWMNKEKWWDKEAEEAKKEAAELLKKIQATEWTENQKKLIKENYQTLPPEIKTAIQQLNRPEAQKWIETSYMEMDTAIKDSKNEKGIAGFFGRIVNKILGQ